MPEKIQKLESGGQFLIELVEFIGTNDYDSLKAISKSLVPTFGQISEPTEATLIRFIKFTLFFFIATTN